MKTIKQIKAQADAIRSSYSPGTTTMTNRDFAMLRFLSSAKDYLETNPTEAFVQKQLDTSVGAINVIRGRFAPPENITKAECTKLRQQHEKLYDAGAIKKHIKMLRFLLS